MSINAGFFGLFAKINCSKRPKRPKRPKESKKGFIDLVALVFLHRKHVWGGYDE